MPLPIKNLYTIDESGDYIVERNVDIPLKTATPSIEGDPLLVRANVYRPKKEGKFPVLATYGPCENSFLLEEISQVNECVDGKDIHYKQLEIQLHPKISSFN